MKLTVDGQAALMTHRGTVVCVLTKERMWLANAPDAADIIEELENAKLTAKDLEARGFTALK